jgi:hypothetical protein
MRGMESLQEFLESNGFYLDQQIARLISVKLSTSKRRVFLLRGPAGVGKTQLTYLISKFLNAKYVFYQCTYGTSEDDLLYKYIPSEETKSGIKISLGPIPLALQLSKTSKVILCIDEFDKTRPSADALMLDLLQNFRVSLYLNDEEQVIEGNPENLVIFLTSNDSREFSEPLLRRVTVIYLNPLPTDKVYAILSSKFKFSEEIAILLAQIYDDTIKAGLRKPATIQELCELGEILQSNPHVNLEFLLRSIIVKYDDDWDKYLQYIKFRKPYKFIIQDDSQNSKDLAEYYKPEGEISLQEQDQQKSNDFNLNQVLEEIKSKFKVPAPSVDFIPEEIENPKEVYMLLEDKDKDAYTLVIKSFKPRPSDVPDEFDKFKVYFDDGKVFITASNPFTVDQLIKLYKSLRDLKKSMSGEFYAEDVYRLVNIDKIYSKLIESASRIHYYTNKCIRVSIDYSDNHNYKTVTKTVTVIEVEVLNRYSNGYGDVIVKHYINGDVTKAYILEPIRDIDSYNCRYSLDRSAKSDIIYLSSLISTGAVKAQMTFMTGYNPLIKWQFDDHYQPTQISIFVHNNIIKKLESIGFKINQPIADQITDQNVISSILNAISSIPEGS